MPRATSASCGGSTTLTADPADAAFRDGAAWYAGEAMRRSGGGAWVFRPGDPERSDYHGRPYLQERPGGGGRGGGGGEIRCRLSGSGDTKPGWKRPWTSPTCCG
jgi:hypothetical protein